MSILEVMALIGVTIMLAGAMYMIVKSEKADEKERVNRKIKSLQGLDYETMRRER